MKDDRKLCQLMERCDAHGRRSWGGVTVVRKCDSQGGVKGVNV